MIIAGYEYKDIKPFTNVYLTGLVRDKQGRKMSKSLGNSPDALKLIEEFGADGVRVGLLLSSAAGNDLLFDFDQLDEEGKVLNPKQIKEWKEAGKEPIYTSSLCQQGKGFANKIFNAYNLTQIWEVSETAEQPEVAKIAIEWFQTKFQKALIDLEDQYSKYRISDALMISYKLVWDDFCSWFLEMVKPTYGSPIDKKTYDAVISLFEDNLKILHPFMPFLTEDIWQRMATRTKEEALVVAAWPKMVDITGLTASSFFYDFELAQEVIAGIRTIRKEKNIPMKDKLTLYIYDRQKERDELNKNSFLTRRGPKSLLKKHYSVVGKITAVEKIEKVDSSVEGALSFRVNSVEYFIPMEGAIDIEAEIEKLTKELAYTEGLLKKTQGKLSNERFVNNAPEQVVAKERQTVIDAETKIATLKASLAGLK